MMQNRPWLLAAAVAALSATTLGGCAATVRSYRDRTADFAQYRTYAWGPADTFTTGDPRLDNNAFFRDRLQTAANAQFAARAFEQTETESADLLLHYHVNITQRIDVNEIDRKYGYCDECRAEVYEAGTLTLDLIDARTGRLVWRGWANRSIDGVLDQQEWMEREIDEAVVRILAQLPRRP
jgi:PBP1b-binding outer membrane lipoprotein LpoB